MKLFKSLFFSIILSCTIYFTTSSQTSNAVSEINIDYSLFDDILADTIGYMDGFYVLNNNLLFIYTDRSESFKINKHIFTFNKITRKAKKEIFSYSSWVGIMYDEEFKPIKEKMKNIQYNNGEYNVLKYKRFINKIRKSNLCNEYLLKSILEDELKKWKIKNVLL